MDTGRRLRMQATGLIVSLIVQYLLGMAANLFVQFPESGNVGAFWQFAWSQGVIVAHIIIGLLLVIGGIIFFIRSFIYKSSSWKVFSGIGLIAILVAAASGSTFVATQNDALSYSMSLAFIVALASYGWGLYVNRNAPSPELNRAL